MFNRRKIGKPILKWILDEENDLGEVKVKKQKQKVNNRNEYVTTEAT
jgi:hypothetical protein